MKNHNDIKFTPPELTALQNKDFFYLKRSATDKIIALFGQIAETMKGLPEHQAFLFPEGTDATSGKISRGENYRQLPYIVLDLPRLYSPLSIFAFRVMYLWGHEFSFSLLLSGEALQTYLPQISAKFDDLQEQHLFVCMGDTLWQHEFTHENYVAMFQISKSAFLEQIGTHGFCKLSVPLSVESWEIADLQAIQTYQLFLELMSK